MLFTVMGRSIASRSSSNKLSNWLFTTVDGELAPTKMMLLIPENNMNITTDSTTPRDSHESTSWHHSVWSIPLLLVSTVMTPRLMAVALIFDGQILQIIPRLVIVPTVWWSAGPHLKLRVLPGLAAFAAIARGHGDEPQSCHWNRAEYVAGLLVNNGELGGVFNGLLVDQQWRIGG